MELIQQPLAQPVFNSSIQGDPAARRFGLCLIMTLAVMTVGAIVGIVAGNIAHYNYNGPDANSNISYNFLSNITRYQRSVVPQEPRLWLPPDERLKRSSTFRKIRSNWFLSDKSSNTRRW